MYDWLCKKKRKERTRYKNGHSCYSHKGPSNKNGSTCRCFWQIITLNNQFSNDTLKRLTLPTITYCCESNSAVSPWFANEFEFDARADVLGWLWHGPGILRLPPIKPLHVWALLQMRFFSTRLVSKSGSTAHRRRVEVEGGHWKQGIIVHTI